MADSLDHKHLLAIEHLIRGLKVYEVAEELDVSPQTVTNWRRSKAFQEAFNARIHQVQMDTLERLRGSTEQAMDALLELLSSDADQVKLNAAKTILGASGHLTSRL